MQLVIFLLAWNNSFAGSTLEVLGLILPKPTNGQWAIIGGTGTFANAHGLIKFREVPSTVSRITDVVRELDIHIFYTPETSANVRTFTTSDLYIYFSSKCLLTLC